jgi:CrcB protein
MATFIGAGLGILLRWWLGLTLNSYFPSIPSGTLAANLLGGYIIGVAIAFFAGRLDQNMTVMPYRYAI